MIFLCVFSKTATTITIITTAITIIITTTFFHRNTPVPVLINYAGT